MFKKFWLLFMILFLGNVSLADDKQEALKFFNNFVQASNGYSSSLLNMYSDDAKITRQIIKPDGSLANAYFSIDDYRRQMRLSSKIAKIRNYKNNYSNVNITKTVNGYRIDSTRIPSLSPNDKLKSSMAVEKQPDGKWLITEELMQTREQIFLRYVK